MKKIAILSLLVIMISSCSDDTSSTSGNVTLKASAVSTTGKTYLTGRLATTAVATSTVVITDFKINIGKCKRREYKI